MGQTYVIVTKNRTSSKRIKTKQSRNQNSLSMNSEPEKFNCLFRLGCFFLINKASKILQSKSELALHRILKQLSFS